LSEVFVDQFGDWLVVVQQQLALDFESDSVFVDGSGIDGGQEGGGPVAATGEQ